MRSPGVNLVTVGVFGCGLVGAGRGAVRLRPARPDPGRPAWGERRGRPGHRDRVAATVVLPCVPGDTTRRPGRAPADYGSRRAICPSSPAYREVVVRLVEQLPRRYHDHPVLPMWHVHNEYACHNARCYCDVSGQAFRSRLRERYGDLDASTTPVHQLLVADLQRVGAGGPGGPEFVRDWFDTEYQRQRMAPLLAPPQPAAACLTHHVNRSANEQTGTVVPACPFGLPNTNDAASGEDQADDRVSSVITTQAVVVPGVAREPARRRVKRGSSQLRV